MAGAVQFYGKDQIMEAAQNVEIPAWAIYHSGKNLFTKYECDDLEESISVLHGALDLLQKNRGDAIYAIKFFEIPEGQKRIKINEKTVCDGGSFNFKMISAEQREANHIGYLQTNQVIEYEKKIMRLEQDLKDLKNTEPPEPETIGSIALDLLKRPDELAQLVNIGRMALGMPQANFGAIGGFKKIGEGNPSAEKNPHNGPWNDRTEQTNERESQVDRLASAIDTLEKYDPNLVEHLEKLAKIATDNPDEFKGKIGIIDML